MSIIGAEGSIMTHIKQIDDSELIELIELYIEYNQCLVMKHNTYKSTKILIDKLAIPNSLALGLYREEKLKGFTLGYGTESEVFRFTDMYILPNYRLHTKKLLQGSESYISHKYKAWVCETHTKEGMNLFERYGAQKIEVKYYKEI